MTSATGGTSSVDRSTTEILGRLRTQQGRARYRDAGEVARGGMGAILRVWDEHLRRPLAMKVVLDDVGAIAAPTVSQPQAKPASTPARIDARRLARFLEEAQITGQLEHPGIVPVHELGVDDDGRAFFTMRLVHGRNLEEVFRLVDRGEEGWTITRAIAVMLRVCEAMAFAHDRRVLHRDLKPANVMVGPFGEVYVMDWGIARVQGEPDHHDLRVRPAGEPPTHVATDRHEQSGTADAVLYTMDGDVIGTPAYMSPEQARGLIDELDARADVYSVGAMLYRLLSGHAPYDDGTRRPIYATLRELIAGPPAPITDGRAPAELVAIAAKAMAHASTDRYPTMLALADDLRAFLENRVVGAYETGPWAEAKKWIGRNRALASSLAAAVLLLVAGLVASLWLKGAADREAQHAETERNAAIANGQRAEKNAAIAQAVNAFLNDDVLAAVAPEHMGANVTVREVLEKAALQLDWNFSEQPEVEATLRMTIGRSLELLGRPDEARRQFERALALRERELGATADGTLDARLRLAATNADLGDSTAAEAGYRAVRDTAAAAFDADHIACLTAVNDLALLREKAGQLAEARAMFEQNLVAQVRALGDDDDHTVTTRVNLGSLLTRMGELDAAEPLLRAALDARKARLGEHHPLTLDAENALAIQRLARGHTIEAEARLAKLLELRVESHGEDHVAVGRLLSTLATVRSRLGQHAQAIADAERATEILQRRLGEDHAWTLVAANNLAAVLFEAGEFARALPLREENVARQRDVLGPEHPETLLSMSNLASVYNSLGRHADAERVGRETLALEERVLGPDHPDTLITRENLGNALFSRGAYAEAAELVQQVLDGRRRALGDDHPAVTRTLYNLAMVRRASGGGEGVEKLFAEVLERQRRELPAGHQDLADVLARLGDYRCKAKDYDVAEAMQREAIAIRARVFGPAAPATTVLMHDLGVTMYLRGDLDRAAEQLRRTFDVRREAHGVDHEYTQTTGYVLARVLAKAKRHAEAEPLLLDNYRWHAAAHGANGNDARNTAGLLADLYAAWGRDTDATEWRAKAR